MTRHHLHRSRRRSCVSPAHGGMLENWSDLRAREKQLQNSPETTQKPQPRETRDETRDIRETRDKQFFCAPFLIVFLRSKTRFPQTRPTNPALPSSPPQIAPALSLSIHTTPQAQAAFHDSDSPTGAPARHNTRRPPENASRVQSAWVGGTYNSPSLSPSCSSLPW